MSGSANAWTTKTLPWGTLPALVTAGLLALAIALLPLSWALLLLAGAGILVAILVEPRIGILLIIPAVPFGSLRQVAVGAGNVGPADVLVVLVAASWLMRMVARREARWEWPSLAVPLLLFVLALLVSSLNAGSLEHSIKEMLKWIEALLLLVFVANEFDRRWARALVATLLLTGTVVAAQGIYQFVFQVGPEGFVLFGRFMRAYGTFEQPNPYAGYLGLTLPLALGLVAAGVLPAGKRPAIRWVLAAAGAGVLMLAALIMSWSRGAWLGFGAAVVVIVTAIAARSGRATVLGLVLVVLVAYVLLAGGIALPPALAQRFDDFLPYLSFRDVRGVEVTDANFAVLERMAHWQSALAMWTDRPWLGVGAGNYEAAYAQYALPLWPLPLGHAHNYYLNVAAEAGALGLAAYLFLWGAALLGAWRAARRASGWAWAVSLGVLGVVVHLGTHNLFDNLFVHSMYLQLGILLGLVPSLARRPEGCDIE